MNTESSLARNGTPWTADDEELLLRLRARGLSWQVISEVLERSRDTCARRGSYLACANKVDEAPVEVEREDAEGEWLLHFTHPEEGWATTFARGSEEYVRGVYERMSRSVGGLRVEQEVAA